MSEESDGEFSPGTIIFDLAIVVYAGYRLWRGGLGWGMGIFFSCALGFGVLSVLVKTVGRRVEGNRTDGAAREIHTLHKQLYGGVHEYRDADDSELRGLDVSYYERTTAALEGLGFRRVGQIINVTAQRATPWAFTVIRCHLDQSSTIMAAVYDVRFKGKMRVFQWLGLLSRDLRIAEMETELSDGRFVTTSNSAAAGKASEFTGISRRFVDKKMTMAQLLEAHRGHLAEAIAAAANSGETAAGVTPVVMADFRAYRASQDRMQLMKSAHRSSNDFKPREQLERIAGRALSEREQRMADEVERLRAQEREG